MFSGEHAEGVTTEGRGTVLHGSCYMVGCVSSKLLHRVWTHEETEMLQLFLP